MRARASMLLVIVGDTDLLSRQTVTRADIAEQISNGGAPGINGITVKDFGTIFDESYCREANVEKAARAAFRASGVGIRTDSKYVSMASRSGWRAIMGVQSIRL
jgi:hypothetical protein